MANGHELPTPQYFGQFCLVTLSVIWVKRSSASSVSLQLTPSGVLDLLEGRKAPQRDLERLD